MHELSLAECVMNLVEDARRREAFAQVRSLRLEVGALAGVDVRSLRVALEALRPGTCLEQAAIVIDEPPGRAHCPTCHRSVSVRSRLDDCPACGSPGLQPTRGTELRVLDLLVEDAVPAP